MNVFLNTITVNVTLDDVMKLMDQDDLLTGRVGGVYFNMVEIEYDPDEFPEAWISDRVILEEL